VARKILANRLQGLFSGQLKNIFASEVTYGMVPEVVPLTFNFFTTA
jgi:hypothetical protein